jgi:hypothetical protein
LNKKKNIENRCAEAFNIMNKYKVNFSNGLSLPTREVFTDVADIGGNIDHDLILSACTNLGIVNIAVQAKSSFDLSDRTTFTKQFLVSPTSLQVQLMFWLYLGGKRREEIFNSIVFLDGSGCCNWLALDLVKKLRSKNHKLIVSDKIHVFLTKFTIKIPWTVFTTHSEMETFYMSSCSCGQTNCEGLSTWS